MPRPSHRNKAGLHRTPAHRQRTPRRSTATLPATTALGPRQGPIQRWRPRGRTSPQPPRTIGQRRWPIQVPAPTPRRTSTRHHMVTSQQRAMRCRQLMSRRPLMSRRRRPRTAPLDRATTPSLPPCSRCARRRGADQRRACDRRQAPREHPSGCRHGPPHQPTGFPPAPRRLTRTGRTTPRQVPSATGQGQPIR